MNACSRVWVVCALVVGLIMGSNSFTLFAREIPSERRVLAPSFTPASGPVKIAFFDADSTLRVAPSGKPSANSATDVAILPMVAPKLAELASEGYLIAVVSNQAGVKYGHVTLPVADAALKFCLQQLTDLGGVLHYYDFAEDEDDNRKPEIGMGKRLVELVEKKLQRQVDWKNSFMVGDSGWKKGVDTEPEGGPGEDHSSSDRQFAENMAKAYGSCPFHHPRKFFGWLNYGVRNFSTYKDLEAFYQKHPDQVPQKP
jgi:DNA 3'-phosphatase